MPAELDRCVHVMVKNQHFSLICACVNVYSLVKRGEMHEGASKYKMMFLFSTVGSYAFLFRFYRLKMQSQSGYNLT